MPILSTIFSDTFSGEEALYPGTMSVSWRRRPSASCCKELEEVTVLSTHSSWITSPRLAHQHLLTPFNLPLQSNHNLYLVPTRRGYFGQLWPKISRIVVKYHHQNRAEKTYGVF